MTHEELIFQALAYRRHVGATASDIRAYVTWREENQHTQRDDRAVLKHLEEEETVVRVGLKWFLTSRGCRRARSASLRPEWHKEDAWILLALLYQRDREGSPLREILAGADFINHALPTWGEMHGALNRLLAGGLIRQNRKGFRVTDKARHLLSRVEACGPRFVMDQWDGLRRMLDCPCCGVKLKKVRWRVLQVEQTFQEAVEAYSSGSRNR